MKLDITRKVPLEYEGWTDCYLEFGLPTYGDLKKISDNKGLTDEQKIDKGIETITGLFRGGFAMSGGERVEVKKEDLKDFPVEILTQAFRAISGEVPPK